MDQQTEAILAKIDEWQQMGYDAWRKSRRLVAAEYWAKCWELVVGLMLSGQFASLEDLDKFYHGEQSIANWITDYSDLLYQSGLANLKELPASIAFNRQVLDWSAKSNSINSFNRRRMIADSIFKINGPEAGDAAYSEFLGEYPRWGWGWASWADQHRPARAEQILRQALLVAELDNREAVLLRLREALTQQGRTIEASGIEGADDSAKKPKKWFQR